MTYVWKCPLRQCTELAETDTPTPTPIPRCHKDDLEMVRKVGDLATTGTVGRSPSDGGWSR